MPELPKCWAYNKSGTRCEQRAGHPSDHSYTIRWTDEECFNPDAPPPTTPRPMALPPMVMQAPVIDDAPPVAPTKCVACGHLHKGGECKCGCHEHIG